MPRTGDEGQTLSCTARRFIEDHILYAPLKLDPPETDVMEDVDPEAFYTDTFPELPGDLATLDPDAMYTAVLDISGLGDLAIPDAAPPLPSPEAQTRDMLTHVQQSGTRAPAPATQARTPEQTEPYLYVSYLLPAQRLAAMIGEPLTSKLDYLQRNAMNGADHNAYFRPIAEQIDAIPGFVEGLDLLDRVNDTARRYPPPQRADVAKVLSGHHASTRDEWLGFLDEYESARREFLGFTDRKTPEEIGALAFEKDRIDGLTHTLKLHAKRFEKLPKGAPEPPASPEDMRANLFRLRLEAGVSMGKSHTRMDPFFNEADRLFAAGYAAEAMKVIRQIQMMLDTFRELDRDSFESRIDFQGVPVECSSGSAPATMKDFLLLDYINDVETLTDLVQQGDAPAPVRPGVFGVCPNTPEAIAATTAAYGIQTPKLCLFVSGGNWRGDANGVSCNCMWGGTVSTMRAMMPRSHP